jgi:hypothetical protein
MNDQSAPGGLHGVLDRLLRFVDTPWKAFALAGLAALAFAGWIVWDKRTELFEAWLTPDAPALRTAEVPEALTKLASETNADLIQIWAVDLASNSQWFLGARRHDGERPVIPSPRRLPIIVTASDVKALIDVMEGHPVCLDLSALGSPLARRLAERGMKRGCAVPIPPNPESFVGVIYLAWPGKTDDSNENVAVGAAREIAKKLATR